MYKEAIFSTNDLVGALKNNIISLCKEFEDVFINEELHGLPPIRGIEHQVFFIVGASIPNRLSFRSFFRRPKNFSWVCTLKNDSSCLKR
ncbi:hypothetical protein MA16_Dca025312 [Dendrobium catenatum]|uniref:Uncharacterized protein n=1 Tax=Dendrobium catenatum TaxID=906689 RepID=A0A2I0VHG4_9ASPA|nr:hypothetical protein MA16_Dca025312 [Dendrobium catenatum]